MVVSATEAKGLEPTTGPGYRKGFETLHDEVQLESLPVQGEVPAWLTGTLVRTGPARFEVGEQRYRHWFDGLAMLHAFSFAAGKVSYRNRYLRSKAYEAANGEGRIAYSEFATDPCRSIFQRVSSVFDPRFTDNANVNISRIAGQFVAMTETPLPIKFDRATLETLGVLDYGDKATVHHTSAHPHYDFNTREAYNYFARFSRVSSYNAYRVPDQTGKRQVFATKSVQEPGYIHSFGLTENYFVLVEFPYVVNPLRLLFSGRPFIENFEWKPDRSARFLVFKRSDGTLAAEAKAPAFFAFHHVNAFEDGGTLQIDIVAYDDVQVVRNLYLDRLRGGGYAIDQTQLRRYHVPLAGGEAAHTVLSDDAGELPRINYRYNGRDYRYAYLARGAPGKRDDFINQLLKLDVGTGATTTWSTDGCYPGEAVFVERPGARTEDDGVVLSVVLDSHVERSFLLILDASSFTEIARASMPHHAPFGFHGQHFS